MQKLAFDIGCNIGKYTEKLLLNGWSVIAVDPNPYLFNNPIDKVVRVVAACSDIVGTIPFYYSNAHTISTASTDWVEDSRFTGQYSWKKSQVPSLTIDELVKTYGRPNHIKIDVEGYELIALKGMTEKYSDELCFEWAEEKGDLAIECVKYLASLGYTSFGYILEDFYLIKPKEYYPLKTFIENFKYNKNQKELWGMIWAK